MKLTVVLTIFISTLIFACSSADVPSADPTPNVNATVEARVAQEPVATPAVDTPTPAPTPTPIPTLIPTPRPTPNAWRLEMSAEANLRGQATDWFEQGVSLSRRGLHEDAIEAFDKAIEIGPRQFFYHNRAHSYQELGQHVQAVEDLTKEITLFESNPNTYLNRASSYRLHLSEYAKARSDELKACSLLERYCASPTIEIINYSSYGTSDIEEWVTLAESKMKDRSSSVLFNIYPVGEQISEGAFLEGHPGAQHKVILEPSQIEAVLSSMDSWLSTRSCISGGRRGRELGEWRIWLEQGVKMGLQMTLCSDTRVVFLAISDEDSNDLSALTNFQRVLFHESYHGFQQDLSYGGECRERSRFNNANSNWMIEGAAEYFARSLLDEINGKSNAMDELLGNALSEYDRSGAALTISGEPWLSVGKGPASLRLMVEKGMLDEASIMDGSLFHDCAREMVFDSTSPEIERIRESWYQIEVRDGVHKFKAEALAP